MVNGRVLSEDEADSCEGEILEDELTQALKNMKLNKAPGSDGLTTEFYVTFWSEIKVLTIKTINSSLNEGKIGFHNGRE